MSLPRHLAIIMDGNGRWAEERSLPRVEGHRIGALAVHRTVRSCRELGIGFVPYSPLGRGFLAGRFAKPEDLSADDWRRHSPRFQGENFGRNLALVEQVKELAKARGCTPSQLALAWLLAQGERIVPIPGTTSRERLEENVGAAAIALNADELKRIEAVFPVGAAAGARYHVAGAQLLNR